VTQLTMLFRQGALWSLLLVSLALATCCEGPPGAASTLVETATPSLSATVLQPSPTASPTLDHQQRIETAHQALQDGDLALAIDLYRQAWDAAEQAARAELLLPLVQTYFAAGQYDQLLALCTPSRLETLSLHDRALALGLAARSYEALGEWEQAISAYQRHLQLDDTAAAYIRQRVAQAHRRLDQPQQALEQLRLVDLDRLDASARVDVLAEWADLLTDLGELEIALAAYDHILTYARTAYYRSATLQAKGKLLLDLGRGDEGIAVLRQVLQDYPQTWGAYAALQLLDELDVTAVTLLQRGQILYHVGLYSRSIETLQDYRRANPFGFHSTAHYYAGLAYHALGQYPQAIAEFDIVIDEFAWTAVAGDAWMAKARTLAALGQDAAAVYAQFARLYPDHPRAPEALWRGAMALEEKDDWQGAGALYAALYRDYPADSRAAEAGFRHALAAYALGDYGEAHGLWQLRLPAATGSGATVGERARRLVWIGLASAGDGDLASARDYWHEAADLDPHGYYSLRAQDLLVEDSLQLLTGLAPDVPPFHLGEQDWQRVEAWVRTWAGTADDQEVAIEGQSLVRQAAMLWQLGWYTEAMASYRQYRDTIVDRPLWLLALARHCYENDVLSMAISCATRLMTLSHTAAALDPPDALWRLNYPTAYGHLVHAESAPQDLDPLLFLALVLQESQFNPHVTSWAGAVGLTQVMPETGAWIAQKLGLQDYDDQLLLRPVVAVRFGTWYLAQALEQFDRSWPVAVAAYNAGWTSVRAWVGNGPLQDPDLFYETIPFSETKAFVQLVYQNYRAYQRIYLP
jgi:soluble lytic murein transglycosylase